MSVCFYYGEIEVKVPKSYTLFFLLSCQADSNITNRRRKKINESEQLKKKGRRKKPKKKRVHIIKCDTETKQNRHW